MIKIRIWLERDREVIAGILVKNGYRVQQGKKRRGNSKSYDYLLIAEDVRGEKGECEIEG